jgi:hypothetical protein
MTGKTMHIRNTSFRYLPNPTPFPWDKRFFSLRRLMKEYSKKLRDDDLTRPTARVDELVGLADEVISLFRTPGTKLDVQEYNLGLLEKLHDCLDNCDVFLRKQANLSPSTSTTTNTGLFTLVLREHFQVIVKMINSPEAEDPESDYGDGSVELGPPPLRRHDITSPHNTTASHGNALSRFDELNAASPEERQAKFMDIYFAVVLPLVRERSVKALHRRVSTGFVPSNYAPSHHDRNLSMNSMHSNGALLAAAVSNDANNQDGIPLTPLTPSSPGFAGTPAGPLHSESTTSMPFLQVSTPLTTQNLSRMNGDEVLDERANDIWCTLMFRMLCWLLLHDFHKKDVQIPKSELLGSRLPVYIT